MKKFFLITLLLSLNFTVWALDDTTQNREQQANRYLDARPLKETIESQIDTITKNMLPSRREHYKILVSKYLDFQAISKDVKESLVVNFTADELKALADFYGSPAGKSAAKKLSAYNADLLPKLKAELIKAEEKANQDKQ